MDQYIGRLLDNRYEILEVIGTGGMAVVYKARCHRLNRLVAIKILKDEYSRDEEFRRRFHAEGEAVAMLSHPNIVQVYDVSSSENADFIVMELIDGITLKQYMEKKGILNWKETLHFGMQIAKALEHAHGRGIVHRDIKPHNVMVLKNGSVKVTDFGIARVMAKTNTLTKEALGSVHYISPEQAKGGWVDNRSDLYSLGVVMYEMMTGRPPYDGESPVAVAIQHINGGAPMPSTLNPNIPGGLEQIIMKAMSLEPNDRYPSATEMYHDMDEFRKNPNILFSYQRPSPVDDATKIHLGNLAAELPRQSRTTAERVAGTSNGDAAARRRSESQRQRTSAPPVSRSTGRMRPVQGNPAGGDHQGQNPELTVRPRKSAAKRRRQEEEKRSHMAAVAVVACSAVAVIAILVFLVALVSGAFFNQNKSLVKVPNLVGQMYEKISLEGLGIELLEQVNHEDFEKGKVFYQIPAAGDEVKQGTIIKVKVSLGPVKQTVTLESLAGLNLDQAVSYLQERELVPLTREEFSDTYPADTIIRTDPAMGTVLEKGDTVWLYVSSGPMIQKEKMPHLIGKSYRDAESILNDLGFDDVTFKPADSDKPADTVLEQSVPAYEETDVTTKIVLTVSRGPEPTEPPTEAPTEAATQPPTEKPTEPPTEAPTLPTAVTKNVTFQLPQDRTEAYVVSIFRNGTAVMEERKITPGTLKLDLMLTGTGKEKYDLYIDGTFYQSVEVEFEVK